MKIVTAGLKFLDIDAYAGCVAYAELLRLKGEEALASSSAAMNESITQTIRSWRVPFSESYDVKNEDTFIIVDVSEPEYLEKSVQLDRVEEVIDHHVGFEEFWRERIGDRADIEFIGAACTLVYERWVDAGLLSEMSENAARLLMSGILDNTLNFKASVTTQRDKDAYRALRDIANLPSDWAAQYFGECEESIFRDIHGALKNDSKMMQFKNIDAGSIAVGQLAIWNAQRVINEYRTSVEQTMVTFSDTWFVNIVSIGEGRSYFLSSDGVVEDWVSEVLGVQFADGLAMANRLWLRKEIFRQDQSYER